MDNIIFKVMKMSKIYIMLIFLFFANAANATVSDYFTSFYDAYMCDKKIPFEKRDMTDYILKITMDKITVFEDYLVNTKTNSEIEELINMIDEEYYELMENLDFEAQFVPSCPIKKREIKKYKKAHKKFMCLLKKNYGID